VPVSGKGEAAITEADVAEQESSTELKPDLAQAGGKDPDKLNQALDSAPAALCEMLGA
jgi:hypothetical protein